MINDFHLLKYINTDVCLQINVRIIIHEKDVNMSLFMIICFIFKIKRPNNRAQMLAHIVHQVK